MFGIASDNYEVKIFVFF